MTTDTNVHQEGRARSRLSQVMQRPRMWAATREAYVATVATLLEVIGYDAKRLYDAMKVAGSNAVQEPGAPLDDAWAASINGRVLAIVNEQKLDDPDKRGDGA